MKDNYKPKYWVEPVEIPETDDLQKRLNEQDIIDLDCNWSNDPAEN